MSTSTLGIMIEAVKFLTTGVSNTAVDFIVLNLFIIIFGIHEGDPRFIVFKAISYIVASTNSFILNKWWVFKDKPNADKKQIGSFVLISGIGLSLNSVVSLIAFHFGTIAFPALGPHVWANLGALCGTAVVLFFNFFSYKLLIFKK